MNLNIHLTKIAILANSANFQYIKIKERLFDVIRGPLLTFVFRAACIFLSLDYAARQKIRKPSQKTRRLFSVIHINNPISPLLNDFSSFS
jgi:hypothetical protein